MSFNPEDPVQFGLYAFMTIHRSAGFNIKHNCEFIVVITDDLAEAFQFFDSQNARGKKLCPHDMLKAYHLREIREFDTAEVETVVRDWEDIEQAKLSALFSDYLYCVKRWVRGNRADGFSEHDIQMFKGVSQQNNYPYCGNQ